MTSFYRGFGAEGYPINERPLLAGECAKILLIRTAALVEPSLNQAFAEMLPPWWSTK